MTIAVDTREAQVAQPTGKGMWTKRVVEELRKRDVQVREFGGSGGLPWHMRTAKQLKKQKDIDLYLSPTSYIAPWLLGSSFPHAIVVHDLIAFESEPHNRKAKLIEQLTLPRALKTAKHIFTVSDATKKALVDRFPWVDQARITTVYEGPTVSKLSALSSQLSAYSYVLCIGTLCPRKNQLRLIQAFNALPDEIKRSTKLILAGGRGWDDEEIVRLAEESENVEWKGYVSDDELAELFSNAMVLAYPSLMEGFGLPVLDAMTAGIPVLTSNRSSLAEVAGDAALLVDPESTEEIAHGLKKLLTDENLKNELRSKGKERSQQFSWEKTVDLILNTIDN